MDVENVIYIFAYNFANVGMKPVCKGWNIFVHLYNKKVLKYGEQDVIFVNLVWVIVEVPLLNKLLVFLQLHTKTEFKVTTFGTLKMPLILIKSFSIKPILRIK